MNRTVALLAVVLLFGCSGSPTTKKTEEDDPPRRKKDGTDKSERAGRSDPGTTKTRKDKWTLTELNKTFKGKSPRALLKSLGPADQTVEVPDDLDDPKYDGTWIYRDFVYDPATEKTKDVWFEFKKGGVTNAHFL